MTDKGTCVICGVETTLKCQRCASGGLSPPFYCGREHQLEHWKKGGHKKECGVGTGEGDTWEQKVENGRTVFMAKKDIPAGYLLFRRKPLLFFPNFPTPKDILHHQNIAGRQSQNHYSKNLLTCVGCLDVLSYGIGMQGAGKGMHITYCVKCKWPLHCNVTLGQCPRDCQTVHEAECKILCERGQTWDNIQVGKEVEKYYHLALLRAALLSPAKKKEFFSYPVLCPEFYPLIQLPNTIPFVREKCGIPISDLEGEMMIKIIFANILARPTKYIRSKNKVGFIMFSGGPTGLVLTHSCIPNCAPYVEHHLSASFKTIRDVKKGDVLTINYSDLSRGIHDRQLDLTLMLRPLCNCTVCADPTEGGTFYSAIKCTGKKCGNGYLQPHLKCLVHGPTKVTDLYTWKCQNSSCKETLSQQAVVNLVTTLNPQSQYIVQRPGGYDGLKSLIKGISGNVVHPNHFIVTLAEAQLGCLCSTQIMSLEVHSQSKFKFDLHKKYLPDLDIVLKNLKMIQPGRIPDYGEFLFCQTQMRMSKMAEEVKNMGLDELDNQLKPLLDDMEESWLIINDNPLAEKFDRTAEKKLRSLYANHLLKRIEEVVPNPNNLESVRTLKSKYCSAHVDLRWSADETKFRQLIIIQPEDVPKLIKTLNDPKALKDMDKEF